MSFSRCVNAFPEKNASEASSPKSPLNPLFRGRSLARLSFVRFVKLATVRKVRVHLKTPRMVNDSPIIISQKTYIIFTSIMGGGDQLGNN